MKCCQDSLVLLIPNLLLSTIEFIKIPNLSRGYDPEWNTNGLLQRAAKHLLDWTLKQNVKGLKAEIFDEKDLTPMLFVEIDGSSPDSETVLFYGKISLVTK